MACSSCGCGSSKKSNSQYKKGKSRFTPKKVSSFTNVNTRKLGRMK